MSHDEEIEQAMHKIGALRYELELLQSENKLVREESDRHYQLWVNSQADLEKSDGVVWNLAVENTHLKAELTDLKSTTDQFKAEVDSLMTNPTSRLLRAEREENARLKAEVDRLTKAGDEMALNLTHIGWNICVEAWHAAKEGKQS